MCNSNITLPSPRGKIVQDGMCYYCSNHDNDGPVVHSHWLGDDEKKPDEFFIHPLCAAERGGQSDRGMRPADLLAELAERLMSLEAGLILRAVTARV